MTKKRKKTRKSREEVKKKRAERVDINETLIENFVNLQKVLTNLSIKFDSLAEQISKLLQLFEISAKSFAEKNSDSLESGKEKDKEFQDKLDTLLEQNKIIAKGLTLMEEKLRERMYGRNLSI